MPRVHTRWFSVCALLAMRCLHRVQAITEMEDHYKNILEVHAAQAASRAAGPGPAYQRLVAQTTGSPEPSAPPPPPPPAEDEGMGEENYPAPAPAAVDPARINAAFPTKPSRRAAPPPPSQQ